MLSKILAKLMSRPKTSVLILGCLSALAFAPVYLFPVLFISFPILLYAIHNAGSAKNAAKLGWCFGFGHFLCGIYWMTFSILTEADKFWWAVPFGVTGLSAILALYVVVPSYLAYKLSRNPLVQVLIFSIVWLLGEYLRGYAIIFITLYGFPWNLLGYAWGFSEEILQITAWVKIYGLSFITIVVATLPALYLISKKKFAVIIPVLIIATLYIYGSVRINDDKLEKIPDVKLRLVQSNVLEHHRWGPLKRITLMKKNIALSQKAGIEDITHVIFSESSSPYFLEEGGVWIKALSQNLRDGQILMTGAMRQDHVKRKLYSTLHAIDNNGKVVAVYDKYRLVPFGEYVPWRNALSFIDTFVGGQDFSSGEGAVTFNIKNTPKVSPLICYDAIFSQSVVDENDYPEWMLNITNDAWFEKRVSLFGMDLQLSSGPYQHFDMIKVRAIENGISMIRVANTGITANIDPFGRVVDSLDLGVTGVLDTELYKLK